MSALSVTATFLKIRLYKCFSDRALKMSFYDEEKLVKLRREVGKSTKIQLLRFHMFNLIMEKCYISK